MAVIGGMHHILGPTIGGLFYILFRELFSIWTSNWLLWFGLVFVGFVLYSPRASSAFGRSSGDDGAPRRPRRRPCAEPPD